MFGIFGKKLYRLARGVDNRNVVVSEGIKSISHELTFKNSLHKKDEILSVLLRLSEKVSRRLRNKNLYGSTVFIKIRYDDFQTYTRRLTINNSFNDTDNIFNNGKELILKNNLLTEPVRLLGIGVSNLSEKDNQMSLFNDKQKKNRLTNTIDFIKDRFGERSICRARDLIFKNRKKENDS